MIEPGVYLFVFSGPQLSFSSLNFLLCFSTHVNFTSLSFLLQSALAYLMTCFVKDFHLLLALLNMLTAAFIW